MEPIEGQMRYTLQLGKYRVTERTESQMKLYLGGSTVMTISLPPNVDVKAGDILTLYTQVLVNANTSEAPIQ
jgi:hypothetical protein